MCAAMVPVQAQVCMHCRHRFADSPVARRRAEWVDWAFAVVAAVLIMGAIGAVLTLVN